MCNSAAKFMDDATNLFTHMCCSDMKVVEAWESLFKDLDDALEKCNDFNNNDPDNNDMQRRHVPSTIIILLGAQISEMGSTGAAGAAGVTCNEVVYAFGVALKRAAMRFFPVLIDYGQFGVDNCRCIFTEVGGCPRCRGRLQGV